jgi:hypothetical protein
VRVFLSYAHEDQELAARIDAAIRAEGYGCFFDTSGLEPGDPFNRVIRREIERADAFVFLASPSAVEPGGYALTELAFAEKRWADDASAVLPVVVGGLEPAELPHFLRQLDALRPRGNVEAEVVAWVEERARGVPKVWSDTLESRLIEFARANTPPRRRVRGLPRTSCASLIGGLVAIGFGAGVAFVMSGPGDSDFGAEFGKVKLGFGLVVATVGALIVLGGLLGGLRGLLGGRASAAAVLDREKTERSFRVHVLVLDSQGELRRVSLEPVRRGAREAYANDIGWAWIRGGLLLQFARAETR